MPLKLNIGLSRKVGESNYGSRGASVNVELEVDTSLANEPTKLHEKIRQLFGLVRTSLAEELNGGNGLPKSAAANGTNQGQSNDAPTPTNGNGRNTDAGQRSNNPRPATASQVKAIYAIARSKKLNISQLVRERFRVGKPEDLNIKDASQFIDELKSDESGGG